MEKLLFITILVGSLSSCLSEKYVCNNVASIKVFTPTYMVDSKDSCIYYKDVYGVDSLKFIVPDKNKTNERKKDIHNLIEFADKNSIASIIAVLLAIPD